MKRTFLLIILLANSYSICFSQLVVSAPPGYLDSLKYQSAITNNDTIRVLNWAELSWSYAFINFDSAEFYSGQAQKLALKIKYYRGEVRSIYALGQAIQTKGDLPKALALYFKAFQIAEENHYPLETAICLTQIGNVFSDFNDWPKAISYYIRANRIYETIKNENGAAEAKYLTDINLGWVYVLNNQLDSASICLENLYNKTLDNNTWHPPLLMFFGGLQCRLGNQQVGLDYLHQSLEIFHNRKDHFALAYVYRFLAEAFKEINQVDSCIYYSKKGLTEAQIIGYTTTKLLISKLLAEQYETRDINQAHYYLKIALAANDELYGSQKVHDLQKIVFDEQERLRQVEVDRIAYENLMKQYVFAAGLSIVLLIAFLLYRNNRQKHRANTLLQKQKEEIQSALSQLKSTQSQLIQAEKMASLGELTAGIAHEIQNPLNFVNNFSEVSTELVDEMNDEIDKGNIEVAREIASDLRQNLEKINHHGKRAGDIVKGMLQHSRNSSGTKELTDLNKLADEYLRLAYHGLRAKDKSFNATMISDFDDNIGKIDVIPQDIGRVILNLITNAFYAVNEKKQQLKEDLTGFQNLSGLNGYEPTVSVSTKKMNGTIEIKVADNGPGIPSYIVDKIFQPFFTTKPTGQGTGLGLSLAYDIVKAHGGELKVESKEGEGTEFIIQIPIV